jgi:hypothetical protein
MSAVVKLSSKMPGDSEINGVDAQAADLNDDPEALRVAVIYYDAVKITHDTDSGTDVPTIRVRRIEPLGLVEDVDKAVRVSVAKAEEKRTGRKAIPFGIVEVGEHAFGDTLPEE